MRCLEQACRKGYTAYYASAPKFFRQLAIGYADGSFDRILSKLARIDVLGIDDWGLTPLSEMERRHFLEVMDDRGGSRSTVITSQFRVESWHDLIGSPTLADAVMERILSNSYRLGLVGETMRPVKKAAPGLGKGGAVNKESLVLKNPRGWFAAGTEVQKAMNLLTDGAFKLFVYLCLNARRDTGRLEGTLTQLARNVKKQQHTVRVYLREMEKAGICRFQFHHGPSGHGFVEVAEEFWPYQKSVEEPPADGCPEFVAEIRKMLQARACVKTSASTADEILARRVVRKRHQPPKDRTGDSDGVHPQICVLAQ